MPDSNQNIIYLEKYTWAAKYLVAEAQNLADFLRHDRVTIEHLCVVIRSVIASNIVLSKVNCKNESTVPIPKKLADEFIQFSCPKFEAAKLARIPQSEKPNSAYLATDILRLMTFAEDNATVNVKVLMMELLLILKNKHR